MRRFANAIASSARAVMVVILVLASLAPSSTGAGARVRPSPRFDPSGDYHIADLARASSLDYAYIDLDVRVRNGRLVASGDVKARSRVYRIASVRCTPRVLRFLTRSVAGTRYRFDGRFTRSGSFREQFHGDGDVTLKGTLTREVKGTPSAAVTGAFLYYPGC